MKRTILAISILAISILACGSTAPRRLDLYPEPTLQATQTPYVIIQTVVTTPESDKISRQISTQTPSPIISLTITGDVAIRDTSDIVRGWLRAGDRVQAVCGADECTLIGGQWQGMTVWRGCTDRAEERKCQSK